MSEEADLLDSPAPEETPPADGKAIVEAKPDLLDDAPDVDTKAESDDKDAQAGDLLSDDEGASVEGVPDQYTFDAPEGIEVDQERLDQFSEYARDISLSQDQYQKLLELDLQRTQEATDAAVNEWNTRVENWKQASRTDQEIGGEDFSASQALAKNSLQQFADDDFKALLKSPSGDNPNGLALSNHPAMLRFLTRVGKVLAEPALLEGGSVTPSEEAHHRMYPTMRK